MLTNNLRLKVLHLCESDIDGGAARAAYRIHRALVASGVDSRMAVMRKKSDDWRVFSPGTSLLRSLAKIWSNMGNGWAAVRYGKHRLTVKNAAFPGFFRFMDIPFVPDILHLHYVMGGMIRIEDLKSFRPPIIWTLHDEWPLTGGCSYDEGCDRYKVGCGRCPLIQSTQPNDLTRKTFERKRHAWRNLRLELVAPCRWMKEKIDATPVFDGHHSHLIPYAIDLTAFRPYAKTMAREILKLDPCKQYVLFGALGTAEWDRPSRKGGDLLLQACRKLHESRKRKLELLILGSSEPEKRVDFGFPAHYLGKLHDDLALALWYSAADLFVAPSRQDNLPNTVVESLACDTPVVAFEIGGMPDMIIHKQTGWLAPPFDVDDLAEGIGWVMENGAFLCGKMRNFAETRFLPSAVAESYLRVYRDTLKACKNKDAFPQ